MLQRYMVGGGWWAGEGHGWISPSNIITGIGAKANEETKEQWMKGTRCKFREIRCIKVHETQEALEQLRANSSRKRGGQVIMTRWRFCYRAALWLKAQLGIKLGLRLALFGLRHWSERGWSQCLETKCQADKKRMVVAFPIIIWQKFLFVREWVSGKKHVGDCGEVRE